LSLAFSRFFFIVRWSIVCISDAPSGASFKVIRVTLGKEVGKRLADMGFTQGIEGVVVRRGFLRGPLQIRIRGYDILIRRFEAAGIEVEPVGDWPAAYDASRFFRGRFKNRELPPGGDKAGGEEP
jgi:ferrous iron transport protein A